MDGLCKHGYEHGYRNWVHTASGWKPMNYPAAFFGPVPLPPPGVRAVKRLLGSMPGRRRPVTALSWTRGRPG